MDTLPPRIGVLGLGEAGAAVAGDLVRFGAVVTGYDPLPSKEPHGVPRTASVSDAVAGADVVLALVPAAAAVAVAAEASRAMAPGTIYADCAAGGGADKRRAAEPVAAAGGAFVDVAILGVVPATGIHTPALLSGPGAARLAPILGGFGMPVEVISDLPGEAAERKLLRSVFMKGMAAAIGEALEAAERVGAGHWLRDQIEDELRRADGSLVERFERGTRLHAARRVTEMAAALELLEEQGSPNDVTRATLARLTRLAETSDGGVG